MSARPKAFFLSAEVPYPIIGGGAIRTASILEYLLGRYDTDVFCFHQPSGSGETPREIGNSPRPARRWTNLTLPYHSPDAISRAWRNAGRLARSVPPLVDRFAGFEHAIEKAIDGERYDVAVVEHFWCAPYAGVLRARSARLVLDLHNIESAWHWRSAAQSGFAGRWAHQGFARAAERMEREWVPKYDLVLVTSQPECHFVSDRLGIRNVAVVKNAMPPRPTPGVEKRDEIVFSGNMEYAPNRMAASFFSREIWPRLMKKRPETRWKIVGKAASSLAGILEPSVRTDFVSNPEDAMIEIATARVAVVPLLVGTGTRLKIVEAWAAGTPVVSTTVGAEGLECEAGRDLLLADDPEAFTDEVMRLLENPGLAGTIGKQGRSRFENGYTWQSAWAALSAWNL